MNVDARTITEQYGIQLLDFISLKNRLLESFEFSTEILTKNTPRNCSSKIVIRLGKSQRLIIEQ